MSDRKPIDSDELADYIGAEAFDRNEKIRKSITTWIKEEKLVPVLGAGLEVDYGLPTWKELAGRLSTWPISQLQISSKDRFEDKDDDSLRIKARNSYFRRIKQLWADNTDLFDGAKEEILKGTIAPPNVIDVLEAAQYIRLLQEEMSSGNAAAFNKVVSDALTYDHWGIDFKKYTDKDSLTDAILEKAYTKDKDLKAAMHYCAAFVKDKHLDVINYNFDNLLEIEMGKLGYDANKVIYDKRTMLERWNRDETNIYHVHGYLDILTQFPVLSSTLDLDVGVSYSTFAMSTNDPDVMDSCVILAEQEYIEAERYPYEWMNSVQADQLLRQHLLFLGFSGSDYNFKRILRNRGIQRDDGCEQHVIFLPIDSLITGVLLGDNEDTYTDDKKLALRKMMLTFHMMERENYLRKYNIVPYWTSYYCMKKDLKQISEDVAKG